MFPATQVAAAHDNKGAVRLLLEKGFVLYSNPDLGVIEATIRVDPKETGNKSRTAMDIATERGSMEVVELLCQEQCTKKTEKRQRKSSKSSSDL